MGVDFNIMRLILTGIRYGAQFSSVATLGRMGISMKRRELSRALEDFGRPHSADTLDRIYAKGPYAEQLLSELGAQAIESIDASPYEMATIVHDMNETVPPTLHDRFTTIIDHGTVEHVFNFPVAIRNCMRMLKVGGYFLSAACGNNFLGHGFYQFSPELYFRVFSEANGFLVKGVFLVEERSKGAWYRVQDPATIGERATLINGRPTYVMLIAQKIADIPAFTTPQQSIYATAWARSVPDPPPRRNPLWMFVKRHLPPKVVKPFSDMKYRIQHRRLWSRGFRSKYYFHPFEPASSPLTTL